MSDAQPDVTFGTRPHRFTMTTCAFARPSLLASFPPQKFSAGGNKIIQVLQLLRDDFSASQI